MAETSDKESRYRSVAGICKDFWESYPGMALTGRMTSLVSALKNEFKDMYWFCGFYVMKEDGKTLEIGPYQSAILATAHIPIGKGVCGTAALEKVTQIVEDVTKCKNYIACDAETKSEIVVPAIDAEGNVIAVLDIDSEEFGAFTEVDKVRP